MRLRAIAAGMDGAIVSRIDDRLASIRETERVAIPLAIESGSRAWGFPSPDSDYDCRFVFVRRVEDYLSPWPKRDVIETPLDGILDVGGWDLAKALRLLLNGNAVIVEWLTSPIVYDADPGFRDRFLALVREVADRDRIARHYLHLGREMRRRNLADETSVALKKAFYVVRPAAALRWLRAHESEAVAPMNFPQLVAECDLPADVAGIVGELLRLKAGTRELGRAPLPALLARFIEDEFQQAEACFARRSRRPAADERALADAFFVRAIEEVWSGAGV